MTRILLTGPPQCGKTTVVQKVVARFPGKAAGFYTREVREAGRRLGFEIVTLDGQVAWLSHVDFPGPHRVGKYGVSLENLHRVGLPALTPVPGVELIVVDEIGKMECLSQAFVAGMRSVLDSGKPVVASVAKKGEGLISEVKRRKDSVVWEVTHKNRDALTDQVVGWIKSRLAPLPD